MVLLAALAACGSSDTAANEVESGAAAEESAAAPAADAGPTVSREELIARLEARLDSVDQQLRTVPNLTGSEQRGLRRDVNAVQTARAQRMGIRRGADADALLASGKLVELPDSTEYWVVRELDFSVPYVTPDTEAMLAEIGERFHAQLDSLGLPRYRFEVTSALRTPQHQARLRRRNANAADGVSAHEFGTTVDIAYRHFAPPMGSVQELLAGAHPTQLPELSVLHDSLVTEHARQRGTELQAVLGRVIASMREEGKLLVMMERQQTVYHTTVARRFPERDPVPPAGTHTAVAATGDAPRDGTSR